MLDHLDLQKGKDEPSHKDISLIDPGCLIPFMGCHSPSKSRGHAIFVPTTQRHLWVLHLGLSHQTIVRKKRLAVGLSDEPRFIHSNCINRGPRPGACRCLYLWEAQRSPTEIHKSLLTIEPCQGSHVAPYSTFRVASKSILFF